MKDPFMLDKFATDEVLHSTLTRLRGKYSVLAVMENVNKVPNQGNIEKWNKRGKEISQVMDDMIAASVELKKSAIKIYSKELRLLNGY